jgi:hypothetical protein
MKMAVDVAYWSLPQQATGMGKHPFPYGGGDLVSDAMWSNSEHTVSLKHWYHEAPQPTRTSSSSPWKPHIFLFPYLVIRPGSVSNFPAIYFNEAN